jgi:nicotinic acid mononucleotide adenylyltransferase
VHSPAETRLELARAAFPDREVELDRNARTVDMLRAGKWHDPVFLIGADEFADFLEWKEPDELLEHVRLGVATRPGYPRERLERVLSRLRRPDRIVFFDIEPVEVASRDLRDRLAAGQPVDELVPEPVARLIRERGLYRRDIGLHSGRQTRSPDRL